jgi:hypothetical protein
MPQIDVTVNWDATNNKPVVSQNPIVVPAANGATVIQWTNGSEVTNFQITGLDSNEFTYPNNNNPVTVFTATDKNNAAGTYSYNVTATHQSGLQGKHDPEIENGSGLP